MTEADAESLHRRMRHRMRAEVASTAATLFLTNGFDETTVDQICDAAGLSRRSFFRYFKGKEDVVVSVFSMLAEEGCKAFVNRPVDEGIWTALRHSMDPFVEWSKADPSRAHALLRLIEESPTLRASYLDRVDRWRASLAAVVAARADAGSLSELQINVISAASMGAFVAGGRAWSESEGSAESLSKLFDEAFSALKLTLPI